MDCSDKRVVKRRQKSAALMKEKYIKYLIKQLKKNMKFIQKYPVELYLQI